MNERDNVYAIIMAGGVGSRFWPMSRQDKPKQFLDLFGNGKSMLQTTVDRFAKFIDKDKIYIVTNKEYVGLVEEQLPDFQKFQILAEPIGRNTAPCIAYASYKIGTKDPNAIMVVAPSDHYIQQEKEFINDIEKAISISGKSDCLVTIGIQPTFPATGYGYIQASEEITNGFNKVKTFTEKPNLELATKMLESGEFLWNSGMFVWNYNAISNAINTYEPELAELFKKGEETYYTPNEDAFIEMAYSQCVTISIDYAVMEKHEEVFVIPSHFTWSDLGTWRSLYDLSEKDENNNVIIGEAMQYNTNNCIIRSNDGNLIITEGLDGYIVVEEDNVFMVCRKENEQAVKDFVTNLKIEKKDKFL